MRHPRGVARGTPPAARPWWRVNGSAEATSTISRLKKTRIESAIAEFWKVPAIPAEPVVLVPAVPGRSSGREPVSQPSPEPP